VACPQKDCPSSRRVTPKPFIVPVSTCVLRDLVPTDYSLPSRLTVSFRGHGCYTVLSPRDLVHGPFGQRGWFSDSYFPFGFARYLHIRFSWRNLKDDRVCRSLG